MITWDQLTPAQRAEYERAGWTPEEYDSYVASQAAGGDSGAAAGERPGIFGISRDQAQEGGAAGLGYAIQEGVSTVGDALGLTGGGEGGGDKYRDRALAELDRLLGTQPEYSPYGIERAGQDPYASAAQRRALEAMEQVYTHGGLTQADRARIQLGQELDAQKERAQREAVLDTAQQRGVVGSGMELAGQLQAVQQSANRISQQQLAVQDMAQRRALAAMGAAGQQASGMQQAADRINMFNAANQTQANASNSQLAAQRWRDQGQVTGMLTGQLGQSAQAADEAEARKRQQMMDLIGTGATVLAAL